MPIFTSQNMHTELLNRTGYIDDERYKKIINDCGQIRRMLISSINTVKEKSQ